MITLQRVTSENEAFEKLVIQLDTYLSIVDGEDHAFYKQFNKSNALKNALVAYENQNPVGIGAYKEYDFQTIEIKRMFTLPEYRGKGIAKNILTELENWAKEKKYSFAILETGNKQLDAITLYKKVGYKIIDNYGQYKDVENSICMMKKIQSNKSKISKS